MSVRVEAGDCLDVIPRLVAEGVACDAVVTDPPYHLTSTLARFGKINIAAETKTSQRLRQKLDGAVRLAHGFMNQQWDGGDIAFRPETWATVAKILRPGAFLLAFGGTRTWHRLACAIEDAGFTIQDTICWLYGSGFPKRRDMLKPAFEPIVLAYKPGGKRTMQIDECRIEGVMDGSWGNGKSSGSCWSPNRSGGAAEPEGHFNPAGRWPANVCHDGSDEVLAAFPDAPGQRYALQGNERGKQGQVFAGFSDPLAFEPRGDTGSAARFFYCAKADAEDRAGSRHPTVKPVELIKWLVALVTPPGGLFLDPFAGSGTAAIAALATGRNAILIEREPQYLADIRARAAFYEGEGRHSLAAKARRTAQPIGGLFAEAER